MAANEADDYKQKLISFRTSCRVYLREKQEMSRLLREHPELENVKVDKGQVRIDPLSYSGMGNVELYQLLKSDTAFVDNTFHKLNEKFGGSVYVMIWLMYVEGRTQASVAHTFGWTRRQMQYRMDRWLKTVLQDE